MAATQAKPAPAAAPSRPRRRCWRCPTIRRPNSATQLRLGRGAVAMVVATGRRLQVAVCVSASVHQARRRLRAANFGCGSSFLAVLDPSAAFPAVLRARSAVVFAGLRLVVGVWAERSQILWEVSTSTSAFGGVHHRRTKLLRLLDARLTRPIDTTGRHHHSARLRDGWGVGAPASASRTPL